MEQRRVRQVGGVLLAVIGQHPRADPVERVEPADRLELVLEVAEHESDEALRLAPLVARGVARLDRGEGERAGHRHAGKRCGGEPRHPPVTARGLALDEVVEPDSEHSGDELEEAQAAAVAFLAQVGGERLRPLARGPAAAVVALAQRGGEAFLMLAARDVAREGLARGDRGEHAAIGPSALEQLDLGIGPARLRGVGRAQDDQILR